MFSWLAINYHTARLGFEAQNTMAFRLLRIVGDTGKLVPDEPPTNLVTSLPDEPIAPIKAAPREVKRRASTSNIQKKTVRVKKRTKRSR
jgi:hypothetical protein